MRKPTAYQLADMNRKAGGRYFSQENLRGAGQTIGMFSVERTEEPGVFQISAPAPKGNFFPGSCQKLTSKAYISARTGRTSSSLREEFLASHRAAPVGVFG